ncbi:hypothetical protein ACOSP7_009148 [Xanthoceras sorbifolium]|uniref:SnoaL-like domain-containing protein n=1 Tax=Xanthoceras sorbifolium TaxID=99658 RepID=A0ABQ8HVR4_9ROSI|nr:hypothetical protein JRO89_XS07G0275200 [Xanthoceras sorbifolium]
MLMSSTISFPSSSSSAASRLRLSGTSLPCLNTHHHRHYHHRFNKNPTRKTPRKTQLRVSSSDNLTAVEVAPPSPSTSLVAIVASATNVVRSFYEGINGRDLASVEELIAEKCVYEDLIFPRPFVGRQAILEFFKKFIDSISADLQFVIDDISSEDSSAVGVTWHLEWKGRPFPFSKGCSFYRLEVVNGKRQIIYGRDSVEPAIKPGETALVAIGAVTWLLQQFPQLADRL